MDRKTYLLDTSAIFTLIEVALPGICGHLT
jgi:hypothetical protein